MAIVNCPNDGCDFPLDLEGMDDGDVFECAECGEDLEVMNNGTKLIIARPDPDDVGEFDDEEEE